MPNELKLLSLSLQTLHIWTLVRKSYSSLVRTGVDDHGRGIRANDAVRAAVRALYSTTYLQHNVAPKEPQALAMPNEEPDLSNEGF